jgi:ABC-type transport system involved in multi-copper enzyme maturation permease subunit
VAAAGIALVVFAWVALFIMPGIHVTLALSGSWIFANLVVVSAIYGAVGGLVATSDSLSREKRDGTLGLLFLTDLRGYDVVLGKLVAAGVRSLYALLAIVPVLAVAMAMGGVTYGQVVLATVAIGNLVFFCMALGLRISVASLNERKALFAGVVLLLVFMIAPWIVAGLLGNVVMGRNITQDPLWVVVLASPFYPVTNVVAGVMQAPLGAGNLHRGFWLSVGLVHLMGWGMLVAASSSVIRVWRAPQSLRGWAKVAHRWEQWMYGQGESRAVLRRRLLELNPFLWVLQRERMKAWYAWAYLGIVLTFWLVGNSQGDQILQEKHVAIPSLVLIQGFLKVWAISECVSRLVEDRRGGAMELLLTTPLSDSGVVQGYWLGLRRLFLGPALALAGFEFVVLGRVLGWGIGLYSAVVLLADMITVSSAAIWYGLVSRGANRALLHVMALALVLPWGLVGLWMAVAPSFGPHLGSGAGPTFLQGFAAWCIAGLMVDGILTHWCFDRTRKQFRQIAAEGVGRSVFGLKLPM